jgi:hypothetical protein
MFKMCPFAVDTASSSIYNRIGGSANNFRTVPYVFCTGRIQHLTTPSALVFIFLFRLLLTNMCEKDKSKGVMRSGDLAGQAYGPSVRILCSMYVA